jgi:hypothetical protein
MATIVIDIDNRNSAPRIMDAIRSFNGVRKVTLEKDIHYPHLDKSIQEIKEGKVTRCKSVAELMEKLNS